MNATHSHVTLEFLLSQGFSSTFPARFFAKIRFTDSCWIWTGGTDEKGYGRIGPGRKGLTPFIAPRASWILHFGAIPQGMNVCHDCPDGDNPACVNPAHLWLGTDFENVHDCINKGRFENPPHVPGNKSSCAKLNWNDIEQIRLIYATSYRTRHRGNLGSEAIGKLFGVSGATIRHIVRGIIWKQEYNPNSLEKS